MLTDNCAARLAQAKLGIKDNIADFVKETDFVNNLKYINKKVTSNKIKHVLAANELDDLIWWSTWTKLSTKGVKKSLMNGNSILKGAKYFFSGVLQNYLLLI